MYTPYWIQIQKGVPYQASMRGLQGKVRVKNTSLTLKDHQSQSFDLFKQKIGIYGMYCILIQIIMKLFCFQPPNGDFWGERSQTYNLDHIDGERLLCML